MIKDMKIGKRKFIDTTFLFLIPTLIIVLQFFSIGTIRVSWILSIVLALMVKKRLQKIISNYKLLLWMIVVVSYPIVTCPWSLLHTMNISLYISILMGLVLFLYIYSLDMKQFNIFLLGCFFSCVLFAIWGCYEAFTGNYVLFSNEEFIYRVNKYGLYYPGVAFANPNDLAQYLVILFPISAVYYGVMYSGFCTKAIIAFTGFLCTVVFICSQSKLALMAFALILILGLILYFCKAKKTRKLLFYYMGAISFIIVLNLKFEFMQNVVWKKVLSVDTGLGYYRERADIYIKLFRQFLINPVGAFGNAYPVSEIGPHNLFLFVLCDFGLFFFLLFCIFLLMIAFNLIRKKREGMLKVICFVSILMFPITSSISSANEQRKITWMFLAIVYCISRISRVDRLKIGKRRGL